MRLAVLASLLALAGCVSAPTPDPRPIAPEPPPPAIGVRATIDGEGRAQAWALGRPFSPLYRFAGRVTLVGQPYPPYLILSGDGSIIVEPVPGSEAEAAAAVARGDVQILRGGVAGRLNAPGSIAARQASLTGD